MELFFKFGFIILIFVLGFYCLKNEYKLDFTQNKAESNIIQKDASEEYLWRLDSLINYKSDLKGGWINKTKTVYFYDLENKVDTIALKYLWKTNDDGITGFWQLNNKTINYLNQNNQKNFLTIIYSEYLPDEKKFNTRTESRINCKNQQIKLSANYHDRDWTGKHSILKMTDSLEYIKTFKKYQYSQRTKDWQNMELKIDSFNTRSKLIQSYSMKVRRDESIVSSLENYQYKDSLLIEKNFRYKESQKEPKSWRNSTKESFDYDKFGNITKEIKAVWDEESSEWIPYDGTNWIRSETNGIVKSKIFLETIEAIGFIATVKLDYLYDDDLNLIKQTLFEWNSAKKELVKNYVFDFILDKQGLILEKKVLNFDNGGYDQVIYNYTYDSEGRLLQKIHKNKNNIDTDWRFVNKEEFKYQISGGKYTYKKIMSSPTFVRELIEYVLDEENNIIEIRMNTGSGSKLRREVTYNKEIELNDVLVPRGENLIHKTYNGEWRYINAPLIKESFSFYQGEWNRRSGNKFYYSKNLND